MRRGVIVIYTIGPLIIDRLVAEGQSWRITDAVLLPEP